MGMGTTPRAGVPLSVQSITPYFSVGGDPRIVIAILQVEIGNRTLLFSCQPCSPEHPLLFPGNDTAFWEYRLARVQEYVTTPKRNGPKHAPDLPP